VNGVSVAAAFDCNLRRPPNVWIEVDPRFLRGRRAGARPQSELSLRAPARRRMTSELTSILPRLLDHREARVSREI
jgi:hypothetical protein